MIGLMASVRSGSVVVAGLRSPLLSVGDHTATTAAILVHGNPGSSHDWRGALAAVGEHTRALAMDMPGFGQADKPQDFDHTVEGYAAHLEAARVELGVERVHLVLHDFGGPWGLAWAARHPELVASVTLINTGVLQDYRWHWLARLWQTRRLGEALMAHDVPRWLFRALLDHAYAAKAGPPPLPREFLDHMGHDFDAGTRHAVLRLYRASKHLTDRAPELAADLRQINCPALVIWGARDHYIGSEQALHQRTAFPRAEVVVLPGSGHWPMIDDPDVCAQLVAEFIAGA